MDNTKRQNLIRYIKSYAGIDGGNPHGDLWMCGLEYGGQEFDENTISAFDSDLCEDLPCWNQADKDGFDQKSWQYGRKAAKLACQYAGWDESDYHKFALEKLCDRNGNNFMMNLYPLAFPSVDANHWQGPYFKQTGILHKTIYIALCMEHRFKMLNGLMRKYKPKNLVCFGTTFKQDFLLAFAPEFLEAQESTNCQKYEINHGTRKKIVHQYLVNDGHTKLFITPFLGLGGIMSNQEITNLSKLLVE